MVKKGGNDKDTKESIREMEKKREEKELQKMIDKANKL